MVCIDPRHNHEPGGRPTGVNGRLSLIVCFACVCVAADGRKVPVFWGYVLVPYLATSVATMIEASKLALVFDLDETLLVANSSSTLDTRMEACRKAR